MSQFPAHASPALGPLASPSERPHDLHLGHDHGYGQGRLESPDTSAPPLVTPAGTPPLTPNGTHPDLKSVPISSPSRAQPGREDGAAGTTDGKRQEGEGHKSKPIEPLPEVWCEVRARIPTTAGQEMFLHLYHNNVDNKEHLAIVFGPHIRSRSLDAPRDGETERDRMIRGAYTGTLFPGRTSSRVDAIRREAGVATSPKKLRDLSHGAHPQVHDATSAQDMVANGAHPQHEDDPREKLGPPLVRIHSECYTGETVWSARCDCGEQLDEAARAMSALTTDPNGTPPEADGIPNGAEETTHETKDHSPDKGSPHSHHLPYSKFDSQPSMGGVIIYLRQEGRGIGLLAKLQAYNLQDLGADTMQANLMLRHPADARSYGLATAMLLDLGLGGERGIRLLTNNPDKVRAVEGPGREVVVRERVPMIPIAWRTGGKEGVQGKEVERYISTKIEKFKHMFSE